MKDTHKKEHISVAKVVELIGSSPNSWEEATANAVEAAAQTVRNIKGVDLKRCTAKVENNNVRLLKLLSLSIEINPSM